MTEFQFPTSNELRMIEQDKMPDLVRERPIFTHFPIETDDTPQLTWEQEDNYLGLQQLRGLGGDPPRVNKTGLKRYTMFPGIYGEFEPVDETELMMRRQYGTWSTPVNIDDLVVRIQDKLLLRRRDRQELILWTLVIAGVFSVAGPSGAISHTDAYTTQTFTASVAWGTPATSTPIADFRAVQLLGRGHSVNFGAQARAYMSRTTYNKLMANTNAADLGGKKGPGLASISGPDEVNRLLSNDDLPQFTIYDEGYLSEPSGTFVPFIADNKVVVIGRRPGNAPIGAYRMVRNVNNPDMAPGAYTAVIDRGADGPGRRIPRMIEVHDGHNGGPVIYYPSAIVLMNV